MPASWYERSPEDIAKELSVDVTRGLSSAEITARSRQYGQNVLPRGKELHWWQLFFRQFVNPMIFILLVAAALTAWLGAYIDLIVILLAVFVNVLIGFWQEFRSNKIFEKLQEVVAVTARVLRGGKIHEIDAKELVPGDVILLHGSVKVPADARLLTVKNLAVNESLLTGESAAAKKELKKLSGKVGVGDRVNMVHMGTLVERGEGTAIVVATGAKTELGEIAALTAGISEETTPLQERLAHFGKLLAFVILLFSSIIFAVGFWEGHGFEEMFTTTVAVIVAAIPEGLLAALSVVLAVSAQRIFRKKGLVKKLIGAETLGSASVIVTDKTGTLTTGKMTVVELLGSRDEMKTAFIMALANEAMIVEDGSGERKITGEETDRAKMSFFLGRGGNVEEALKKYPRCSFLPFNQEKKYIASFHALNDGTGRLFVSGAPEMLLELSRIDPYQKTVILREVEEYAARGFRMIGAAERVFRDAASLRCDDEDLVKKVQELTFVGLAVIRDPIRPDVREAMRVVRSAGVRVIMATGDHRLTAVSIGRELGFRHDKECVVNGEELNAMSQEEFMRRIDYIEILSRVSPVHKMRAIEALRAKGGVVAMTGDGVNDAPALKSADIGIALTSGSDVTKEAADLVLLDNSFSVITAAIRQGRIAFDNMRKITVLLLSNSFTEVIAVLSAIIFKVPLPLTAVQILWANLIEGSFPNFVFAFEPGEDDIMRRKPLRRREPILDAQAIGIVFVMGLLTDIVLVCIFLFLYFHSDGSGEALRHIRTLIFALLATDTLFIMFSLKSYRKPIWRTKFFDNKFFILGVIFGFAATGAAIYVPPFQRLLRTTPLGAYEAAFVFFMGVVELALVEIVKWWFRKKRRGAPFMHRVVKGAIIDAYGERSHCVSIILFFVTSYGIL